MPDTTLILPLRGHVVMEVDGDVVLDQHNQIVETAYEAVLRALMSDNERVANIVFAVNGGRPVTRGTRLVGDPVATTPAGASDAGALRPIISKDEQGRRVIGTWSGLLSPAGDVTFDCLGLSMTSGLLFAGTAFPSRTVNAGSTVVVRWTIHLLG